jgi:glycosyltransferase involved in cell wall biosynthesis
MTMGPQESHRLLLISASDYQSAVIKGVVPLLADFDENGFFERVLIAFPFARSSCEVNVTERVVVRDIGTDWLPFRGRFRALRRFAAPLHIMRTVAVLVREIRKRHLHIVRATDPAFSGIIGWMVARLTGRPFCVSIHADWDKRHELGGASSGAAIFGFRWPAKVIERFVLRRADMVMPIRESLIEYALRCGARSDRICVIPHGTDLREFVEPASTDLAPIVGAPLAGRQIISFVGRLVQENYVDDVLKVARALGEMRQDWILLVVGGGPEEQRLQNVVSNDRVLAGLVRFVGFQPRAVVSAVRQASSVSLCLMGGFSLIEACAAASPVIAYDVEWHAELVRNGETGYLIAEHDVRQVVDAANRLLDHGEERRRIGDNARKRALMRHGLEGSSATKRQCYLEAIGRRTA